MSPDWAARPTAVPYALFGDPQSLNLYGYVRNDPVTRADDDGHQDPPRYDPSCKISEGPCRKIPAEEAAQNQGTNWKQVGKGFAEIGGGGLLIGLSIAGAPETGGGSLAAIPVALGILSGEGAAGKGIIDVANGAGAIDNKTTEAAKQGVELANNPVAANAAMVTDPKTAINIGNVATGALAIHDLAQRPQSLSEGINKVLAARDVTEGYQSAKELVHQWAQDLYQHSIIIP